MDLDRQAAEIIEGAEKGLAALAARAASGRDYDKAGKFLGMAQRIAAAGDPLRITTPQPLASHLAGGFEEPQAIQRSTDPQLSPPKKIARLQYPLFRREDGTLVKIGWSKSERATYEHRSPLELLERLSEVVSDLGAKGRRFTTESILPPHEPRLADAPSYQVYLCLAFLVLRGIVQKHGRSGYTIAAEHVLDLGAAVSAAWDALPNR